MEQGNLQLRQAADDIFNLSLIMKKLDNIIDNSLQYSLFADEMSGEQEPVVVSGGADLRAKKADEENSELDTPVIDLHATKLLKFISFGSGSSGNCSYIGNEEEGILIDAGVDMTTVLSELRVNNIRPESIKGICLTHDHGDHIRYAYTFLRKFKPSMHLFCTNRVLNGILRRHNISRRIKDYHVPIYKEIPFKIAGFEITAFEVLHDGNCNSGFSIEYGDARFVLATDLGSISERARHYMSQANYLVIESNYDARMLDNGTYPEYLKARIRAANGHLDNVDAASFLAEIYSEELKYVFLCHLSKDNNTPEIAREASMRALLGRGATVGEGTDSLSDRTKDVQLMVLPRYDATRCFKFRVEM